MNSEDKTYINSGVSEQLDIGESTLRKWCIELEENGYNFTKGAKGTRNFSDTDIAVLFYFKYLTRARNYTMKQASEKVLERYGAKEDHDTEEEALKKGMFSDFRNMMENLIRHANKQEEFNQTLLKRLDQQDELIKCILEYVEKKKQEEQKNH